MNEVSMGWQVCPLWQGYPKTRESVVQEMSEDSESEENETPLDIGEVEKILNMSYYDMFRMRRFAPIGHPYFQLYNPLSEVFEKRFAELHKEAVKTGENIRVSKALDW